MKGLLKWPTLAELKYPIATSNCFNIVIANYFSVHRKRMIAFQNKKENKKRSNWGGRRK